MVRLVCGISPRIKLLFWWISILLFGSTSFLRVAISLRREITISLYTCFLMNGMSFPKKPGHYLFLLANLNIKKKKEKKIIKHFCAIHNTVTALQEHPRIPSTPKISFFQSRKLSTAQPKQKSYQSAPSPQPVSFQNHHKNPHPLLLIFLAKSISSTIIIQVSTIESPSKLSYRSFA